MANFTQIQTIEVAFYGATLLVAEHNHQPYVPMKPVVSGMGLAWQSQLAKLTGNAKRWGITEIVIPTASGEQGMSCLPLRKLPGWLATISPNKVRPELREKVIAFQNEADDVLWQAWQEKQPPAPAQRPYNPAIDYTRISPAQAQDIKELVHQVVDAGVQTFGETWSRLHNKFRVNSYLELPATKYDEVCAYLRGKLPPAPAPAPAPKPAPAPQPSFITKSVFISPTAIAKCIELRDDGSKQGVSFASNLLGEIQFALMFNGSAAHTRLTVSSAREMGNALLEVANAQAALEQRAASAT